MAPAHFSGGAPESDDLTDRHLWGTCENDELFAGGTFCVMDSLASCHGVEENVVVACINPETFQIAQDFYSNEAEYSSKEFSLRRRAIGNFLQTASALPLVQDPQELGDLVLNANQRCEDAKNITQWMSKPTQVFPDKPAFALEDAMTDLWMQQKKPKRDPIPNIVFGWYAGLEEDRATSVACGLIYDTVYYATIKAFPWNLPITSVSGADVIRLFKGFCDMDPAKAASLRPPACSRGVRKQDGGGCRVCGFFCEVVCVPGVEPGPETGSSTDRELSFRLVCGMGDAGRGCSNVCSAGDFETPVRGRI